MVSRRIVAVNAMVVPPKNIGEGSQLTWLNPTETVTATVVGSLENAHVNLGPSSLLELLQCNACGQGFLVLREDYGQGWDDFFRIWPREGRLLSHEVPEPLRKEHDEARL